MKKLFLVPLVAAPFILFGWFLMSRTQTERTPEGSSEIRREWVMKTKFAREFASAEQFIRSSQTIKNELGEDIKNIAPSAKSAVTSQIGMGDPGIVSFSLEVEGALNKGLVELSVGLDDEEIFSPVWIFSGQKKRLERIVENGKTSEVVIPVVEKKN